MEKLPLFATYHLSIANLDPTIESLAHYANNADMAEWHYHIGAYADTFAKQVSILIEARAEFTVVRGGNLHGIFIYQDHNGNNNSARYKVILYRELPEANNHLS